jgi:hypothetical protein
VRRCATWLNHIHGVVFNGSRNGLVVCCSRCTIFFLESQSNGSRVDKRKHFRQTKGLSLCMLELLRRPERARVNDNRELHVLHPQPVLHEKKMLV